MKKTLGLPSCLAAALLAAGPLHATKPCSPETWAASPKRPAAEWARAAAWVAVAKVTARREILRPYPNCHLADQSQCETQDASEITVKVTRPEKGDVRASDSLKLAAAYCAPPPPKAVGETLRFYGREPGSYIYFEKVPTRSRR